ncbi:MAG: hypothetical protein B7Y59_06605 [Burkholderiales bacterium 35-55-47]|jgi:hypothetical protein|uniref:hypothetical protein n=1 Tax=Limnohabitans sp. TaxID=1907725 RepID=UPI000BD728E9|nr:hypothetical protein [Limnohabitans sp.]OYY18765.1 MAG: hypothetical protein B7Y59_06605 [Burkholderiales bacterium 35-55-47]OYZ73583.1 MAG: hypothetical protein B7Y06_06035 [Burkholderiales bacterium 24-55-52]OZB00729.1 MAG: hypothetical protein B7X62_06050 [Burkholderiales bacterium 39-55-53]HQR85514.1 hypothetical protein [Limnohabitans sp.]HQS26569.1 hypothetical protein [Limnohabitans sp.]
MTPEMLYALRDQSGVPSHPVIFLILGVITFALHIAAVQVMLGAATLTLRGAFHADMKWRRLASAMLLTAKIAVSVAIVIGVAPLLFVQVVYDPFWYTSNVLSAWWVIGFILILIAGYISLYAFYWKNHDIVAHGGRNGYWLVLSLALLLTVGFIVHSLSNQMFYPERWIEWYAPGGQIDPSGQTLHQWHLSRFLFFIALSAPVIGAWLLAYRRYLQGAKETDVAYLDFVLNLALRLMVIGGVVSVLIGAAWMMTLPEKMQWFAGSVWMWLAVAALLAVVAMPLALRARLDRGVWGYAVFGAGAVALIVVGAAREVLRFVTLLGSHGYDAMDYRINMDWYSTVLFFVTFGVIGGTTLAYLLTVAWQAGQQKTGTYTPSALVNRIGQWSVGLLVAWTVAYFAIGFWVWAR